jgi:hypothetical protein
MIFWLLVLEDKQIRKSIYKKFTFVSLRKSVFNTESHRHSSLRKQVSFRTLKDYYLSQGCNLSKDFS